MEGFELLKKLGNVNAPPDFEQRVMRQLALRKSQRIRTRRIGFSLAGAFSALAVLFVLVNVFISLKGPGDFLGLRQGPGSRIQGEAYLDGNVISLIETVDYSGELRSLRGELSEVYLLEQISDRTDTRIKY